MDIQHAQGEMRSVYIGGSLPLELVFSALMVLVGEHYLPFATLYWMRMFLFLAAVLIAMYFSETFSLGSWIRRSALFVFAWIGRSIARGEQARG